MYLQGLLGIVLAYLFIVMFNNVIPYFIERRISEEKSGTFMLLILGLELLYMTFSLACEDISIAVFMSGLTFVVFIILLFLDLLFVDSNTSVIPTRHKLNCSIIGLLILLCINAGLTDNAEYNKNIVTLDVPEIVETRYEIIGGSDTTKFYANVNGMFTFVKGTTSEDSYYKIFYETENEKGESIAKPLYLKESETEIVLMPETEDGEEYLIEINSTYYEEDRNKEPVEKTVDRTETSYKLYLYRSTFTEMKIDGKN